MTEHDSEKEPAIDRTARLMAEAGRETVSRTREYVRDGFDRATQYTHDLTGRVGDQIAELTGRSPDAWGRDLRQFVERSPLKALILAVGIGYLLGRAVRR